MKDKRDVLFEIDSIEELACKIRVDKENLKKTVEEYNIACDTGRDEIFYKDPRSLRPLKTRLNLLNPWAIRAFEYDFIQT